jgi:hypothetical protein
MRSHTICSRAGWRDSIAQDSRLSVQADHSGSEEHRPAPGTQSEPYAMLDLVYLGWVGAGWTTSLDR